MNTVHFRQPRRHLENFMEKSLLCMRADKLKPLTFQLSSKLLQFKLVSFYTKSPNKCQKCNYIHNSQVTQMHPICIAEVIKMHEHQPKHEKSAKQYRL